MPTDTQGPQQVSNRAETEFKSSFPGTQSTTLTVNLWASNSFLGQYARQIMCPVYSQCILFSIYDWKFLLQSLDLNILSLRKVEFKNLIVILIKQDNILSLIQIQYGSRFFFTKENYLNAEKMIWKGVRSFKVLPMTGFSGSISMFLSS